MKEGGVIACEAPRHPLPAAAPGNARRADRNRAPARPAGAALGPLTATFGTDTMDKFDNFIDGEWVGGSRRQSNVNPSDTSDVIGAYAQADEAEALQAIAVARAAFPGWAVATPQVRFDVLDAVGSEMLARKDEIGRMLSREEGKTLPEGIGETVRAGDDLQVLRRRGAAHRRRSRAFGAPRCRRRGFPPAAGRGRADHAVEFPDRDPGLEDRAGARLRQLRGLQAGRTGARQLVGDGRDHQPQRAAARVCSTS